MGANSNIPTGSAIRTKNGKADNILLATKMTLKHALAQTQGEWSTQHKQMCEIQKAATLLQDTWNKHTTRIVKEGKGATINQGHLIPRQLIQEPQKQKRLTTDTLIQERRKPHRNINNMRNSSGNTTTRKIYTGTPPTKRNDKNKNATP